MIKTKLFKFFCALSLFASSFAYAQNVPREVEAVRNYLLNSEYPEVFSNNRYRIKIENIIVADLDEDGTPEVIVHLKPHFRQSPTIMIFKVSKDLHVQRVTEGLAPGPLRAVSGKYLDSHSLGEGVDFQAKTNSGYSADDGLVRSVLKSHTSSLVVYKHFAHLDSRQGLPTYIDMRDADWPENVHSCGDFEFSDVERVEITSRFSRDGRNVIAAYVGNKIYTVRIERFLPDGLLEKSVTVHPL